MRRWRPQKPVTSVGTPGAPPVQQTSIANFFKSKSEKDNSNSIKPCLKRTREEAQLDLTTDCSIEQRCNSNDETCIISDHDDAEDSPRVEHSADPKVELSDSERQRLHRKAQQRLAQETLDSNGDSKAAQPFTPLEKQVAELKRRHRDMLLFIEVGYKMRLFGEDAIIASEACHIFAYQDRNYMTAGVPVHRLHVHVRKLVAAGHKVGIVRQLETAAVKASEGSRGPFQRKLTATYTAATIEAGERSDVGELTTPPSGSGWNSAGLNAHLLVVVEGEKKSPGNDTEIGLLAVEISTGDVIFGQFRDNPLRAELEAHLLFTAPQEILQVGDSLTSHTRKLLQSFVGGTTGARLEAMPQRHTPEDAAASLADFFQHRNAERGSAENPEPVSIDVADEVCEAVQKLPKLGAVALAHAIDHLRALDTAGALRQCVSFRSFDDARCMQLSPNALHQLEILRNEDGEEHGSLLGLLNRCQTSMGSRLLRSWVAHPLVQHSVIVERQLAIAELLAAPTLDASDAQRNPLLALKKALSGLPDLERGLMRILHCTSAPVDLWTVLASVKATSDVLSAQRSAQVSRDGSSWRQGVQQIDSSLLRSLYSAATDSQVASTVDAALGVLDETAARSNDKEAVFADRSRFPAVFEKADAVSAAHADIMALLPLLRRQLRIPSLKYVHPANQGDGFLVEVPSARKDIPKDWQKVSSTKSVNRFYPPQVRAAVTQLLIARERHSAACAAGWLQFQANVGEGIMPLRNAVRAIASLDALHSLANVSATPGYVRPEVVDAEDGEEPRLVITAGRHPMLDLRKGPDVVPNDVRLQASGPRGLIITGPNMGGKSCFIRMAALLAIMAQVGAYVPAEKVEMTVVDRVFARMGASDNLAQGRSTFLEELSETSDILRLAGPRSLVIMDELGRGTSTHDGVAIAAAVLRHLTLCNKSLLCFVTHYPQVAQVSEDLPHLLKCAYMGYLSSGAQATESPSASDAPVSATAPEPEMPQVTFLFKMEEGVAGSSFGLNVARLARLPPSVVTRAAEKAADMARDISRNSPREPPSSSVPAVATVNAVSDVLRRLKHTLSCQSSRTDVTEQLCELHRSATEVVTRL